MAARKRPLRSLSILLTALLVNGSILVLVFRGMTHSGANGRNVERQNLTSSRTDRPRSATGGSVSHDPRQDSAKVEKNRAGKNAKPDADADGKGRIELAEKETTSRAAGSNGFKERQGDSTLASEGEQPGPVLEDSPDHEGNVKPGKDPRAGALASYEARRARAGDRVEDQKRLKKKAETFWSRELSIAHKQMHHKDGRDAAKKAFEAATRVESVTDPLAVPSLWSAFAGHHKHHRLLAGVLSQIKTKEASEMLSALAVYSFDEKARVTATQALASRNPDEFIDKLLPLLNHRLNYRVEEIDNGSGGRTRILLIEGQEANYQLLYPSMDRQEAASCFGGFYAPGITSRQAAQQFNEAQSRMARALTDQQIESDKAAVEALNQSIADLNRRVIQVLSQTSGVSRGPNPEAWRRWLAERQGKTYLPLESRQKPTLAQVVLPLYSPTFLPIAPAPS